MLYLSGRPSGSNHLSLEGPLSSVSNGLSTLTYTPFPYFNGRDECVLVASDDQGLTWSTSNELTVGISVQSIDDAPKIMMEYMEGGAHHKEGVLFMTEDSLKSVVGISLQEMDEGKLKIIIFSSFFRFSSS